MKTRWSQTLLTSIQWQDKRKWAQREIQEIHFKLRKSFFTVREVKYWHRLPRVAAESPALEIHKTPLDMILSNLLHLSLQWTEGLDHRFLSTSTILWFSDSEQRNNLFLSSFQQFSPIFSLFSCFPWEISQKNPNSSNFRSQLLKFRLSLISFGLFSVGSSWNGCIKLNIAFPLRSYS